MSLVSSLPAPTYDPVLTISREELLQQRQSQLEENFGRRFSIWSRSGELLLPGDVQVDEEQLENLIRDLEDLVPQFLNAESPAWLSIPLPDEHHGLVAAAPFVTQAGQAACAIRAQYEELAGQPIWQSEQLLQLAAAAQGRLDAESKNQRLEAEIDQVSAQLSSTYEEISLLYGVTQNLRLSQTDEELASLVLDWLLECLPAEGVAIQLLPVADEQEVTYKARVKSVFLTEGECPVGVERFDELIESLDLKAGSQPFVANHLITSQEDWILPCICQVIVAPMYEGDNVFGWLAAFNHRDGTEFGTIEASLLSSLGAILGIHAGNFDLYREQSEFLASVVRALSSAIDAKDPYTCGHSDRVARVSVRLAKEVGFSKDQLATIYMAGLLHDIGKIGIDDEVLRKPGRLTDAEFEHIKLHPELGHRILADIKQFRNLLPAVLHHHEQWDGCGYPHGLEAERIPRIARVVAVADAYDAMTSDRPYRKGISEEKVNEIFRKGAGQQWDAEVVAAYFRAIEDIRQITDRERANLTLDVQQWT